jgi:hypothetical protein
MMKKYGWENAIVVLDGPVLAGGSSERMSTLLEAETEGGAWSENIFPDPRFQRNNEGHWDKIRNFLT